MTVLSSFMNPDLSRLVLINLSAPFDFIGKNLRMFQTIPQTADKLDERCSFKAGQINLKLVDRLGHEN